MSNLPAKKINVAQVIGRLDGGGAQRLTSNLAEALGGQGLDCSIIALRAGGSFVQQKSQADGVHVLSVDPGNNLSLLRGLWALRRLVRSLNLDLLHIHGASCLPFCVLAFYGRRWPCLVFTWHDSSSVLGQRGWRRVLMAYALHRCDRLYGSSRNVAARLASALNNRRPVGTFVNGVPPTAPRRNFFQDGLPHIIWVGRLVPPKDPLTLIKAVAQLMSEGLSFRVTIVGNAPEGMEWYQNQVEEQVRKFGLGNVISMPGWVSRMREIYATADIAVQTSETEGLSMALLEQMMAGLAIVATDVGDTKEALLHGRCGLLINPGDVKGLVDHLRSIIAHPELCIRFGAEAHQRALEQYSLEAMAKRAYNDYVEVCQAINSK